MFRDVEPIVSGVGVLDKAMTIIAAVEEQPCSLGALVETTGLSRATAHRLAVALEMHGLLRRDHRGRFTLGARSLSLGRAAARGWPLAEAAQSAMAWLRDTTGESTQLYVREGDRRVCIASLQSPHGLRTIVETGASLPLDRGSGGRALLGEVGPEGWVATFGEREAGVASVSAPILDPTGAPVAAVGISGPIDRLGPDAGRRHGPLVAAAADRIRHEAGLTGRPGGRV